MTTYRIELHGKGLDFLACTAKNISTKKVEELISNQEQGTLTRADLQAASRSVKALSALRGAVADEFTLYVGEAADPTQPLSLNSATKVEIATMDASSIEPDDSVEGVFVALDWLEGEVAAYQLQTDSFDANNLVLLQNDASDITDDLVEVVTACIYAKPQDLRSKFAASLEKAAANQEREVLQELIAELDEDFAEDYDADELAHLLEEAIEGLRAARGIAEENDDCKWFLDLLGDLVCSPVATTACKVSKTETTFEEN